MTTKTETIKLFREIYGYNRNDLCAQKQDWLNFIDSMNKDGELSENQVSNWTYPFTEPFNY